MHHQWSVMIHRVADVLLMGGTRRSATNQPFGSRAECFGREAWPPRAYRRKDQELRVAVVNWLQVVVMEGQGGEESGEGGGRSIDGINFVPWTRKHTNERESPSSHMQVNTILRGVFFSFIDIHK